MTASQAAGHLTEKIVAALYEGQGCAVRFTIHDHPRPPYDLEVESPHGHRVTVEVKSWNGDGGACFETDKYGRTPEYIKDCERVDLMVRYHESSGVATEIDNKKLVAVLKKHVARFGGDGRMREYPVGTPLEGSLGVVLDVTDKAIGYRRRLL